MKQEIKKWEIDTRIKVKHPPVKNVETGEIFKTYTEAGKAVGGSRFGVYRCAIGIQSHHKGYHFVFVD